MGGGKAMSDISFHTDANGNESARDRANASESTSTSTPHTLRVHIHGVIPTYASEHAAGADLKAYITDDIIIRPWERVLIPTHTYISIPFGYEGQVRPRSGLAIKHGISLINSPGTIDADYRGELKIPLINMSDKDFLVSNGDRIAQLIISLCMRAIFIPVEKESLSNTVRGEKGFGSTGIR